jgi:TonB family protein
MPSAALNIPTRPAPRANERMKDRFTAYVFGAVVLSALLHFAVITWGRFMVLDFSINYSPPLEQIDIQRKVEVPPPPADIPRPAVPVVATSIDVSPELTIGSVLIRDNPVDRLPPPPTPNAPDLSEQPAFTPYSVKPELRNAGDVQKALERNYPRALKDAGIGGTTLLWVFIDVGGIVRNTRVVESSGYAELDEAAREVMVTTARFSPAYNRDERVPVWIQIPVTFRAITA